MFLEWQETVITAAREAVREYNLAYPRESVAAAIATLEDKIKEYEDLRLEFISKAEMHMRETDKTDR